MSTDILTMVWKERKGFLRQQGRQFGVVAVVFVPFFISILLPLQIGEGFAHTPFAVLLCYLIAVMVVCPIVPESFAGERERHTLETLLSGRLLGGVIISLRGLTAQAAAQTLMLVFLIPLTAMQLFSVVAPGLWRGRISGILDVLGSVNWTIALLVVLLILSVVTALLIWGPILRFQRQRLMLS